MRLESTLARTTEALPASGDKDSRIWRGGLFPDYDSLLSPSPPMAVAPGGTTPKVCSNFSSRPRAPLSICSFTFSSSECLNSLKQGGSFSLSLRLSCASTIPSSLSSPWHSDLRPSVRPHEHLSSWPPSCPNPSPSLPLNLSFFPPSEAELGTVAPASYTLDTQLSLCSINGNVCTVRTYGMILKE